MNPLQFLAGKPVRFRQQIVGFLWLPVFGIQFVNIASWLAAQPMEVFEFSGFEGVPPPEARSFYANHGSPVFNEHGTIGQEPLVFGLWIALFLLSFAAFVISQKYVGKWE